MDPKDSFDTMIAIVAHYDAISQKWTSHY